MCSEKMIKYKISPLQLSIERYEFFPTNRALSLSSMDEDSTESKVDDLLHYVMQLGGETERRGKKVEQIY